MLSRMTLEQLYTWIEYNNLDPFTSEREDWRHAQTTAAVYNVNITEKGDRLTAKDFMMESIEERIEREVAESKQAEMTTESANAAWGMYMQHLEKVAKPTHDGVYKG